MAETWMIISFDYNIVYAALLMVHSFTGMPIPTQTPIFELASKAEAAKAVIGDELPGGTWGAYTDTKPPYKIVFRSKQDLSNLDDFCGLAHELTHYMQFMNNVTPFSPPHYESQAYEVQALCYMANKDYDSARWARVQAVKYLLSNQ